jgi:hypothetical protein
MRILRARRQPFAVFASGPNPLAEMSLRGGAKKIIVFCA